MWHATCTLSLAAHKTGQAPVAAVFAMLALLTSSGQLSAETSRPRHVGLLIEFAGCESVEQRLGTDLAAFGWSPGRDVVFDCLFGPTQAELPVLAATLVSHGPDVICTFSGSGVRALKSETTTIPIVMLAPDPVRIGLVASLARPGGNVTGFAQPLVELIGKRIEIAREAIPSIHRIGVLGAAGENSTSVALRNEFASIGAALGIEFRIRNAGFSSQNDYVEAALTWAKTEGVDAIYIASSAFLVRNAQELVAGATRLGLPVIADVQNWVEPGAFITYFADLSNAPNLVASYVDRVLRGAKPADLPIQQPTKYELVINLKTAKALGLAVPQSLLQRADEVIE